MKNTLLDLSSKTELTYLSELTRAFRRGAQDLPFFVAGATARDVLLQYAHGIHPGRDTRDADIALMVPDWASFRALRSRLISDGNFMPNGTVMHKLLFSGRIEVDFIPFGGIEEPDRTLVWPPDGSFTMEVFGFREAFGSTIPVRLPAGEEIQVVSLAALAVLKLLAWKARRLTAPGKDSYDLALIIRNYLEAGNHERLYVDAGHLLDAPDFDYELAGAWLLGHDIARILPPDARTVIAHILKEQVDPHGTAWLVGDMPIVAENGLALLKSVEEGLLASRD